MQFKIEYHRDVQKDLHSLSNIDVNRIRSIIEKKLTTFPQKYGKPLRNTLKNHWSLRVGSHRIIYKILEEKVVVYVVKVGKRDTVYDEVLGRIGL